ncbi:MAG TPA: RIP metalloprotease RseP [Nevskiaceae bacterium]
MDSVEWSILGFVIAIAVLVTFHEYGHFWVARRLGVKVLRFSVGFGKPLWRHVGRDGVEYAIAWIPLGGYVKMADEREGEVADEDLPRAFNRQKLWKRALIVFAGPFSNFILAIVLYWIVAVVGVPGLQPVIGTPPPASIAARAGFVNGERVLSINGAAVSSWQDVRTAMLRHALSEEPMNLRVRLPNGGTRDIVMPMKGLKITPNTLISDIGLEPYLPPIPPVLTQIVAASPAQRAGFRDGDRLVSYDGTAIHSWQQWVAYVQTHPGNTVHVVVERVGKDVPLTLTIGDTDRDGRKVGVMGAGVTPPADLFTSMQMVERKGVLAAVPDALGQTWGMTVVTLQSVYRVVTGSISPRNLGGPIVIAKVAGEAAHAGITDFMTFLAFVSVNLGVLNLFPIPALDGGHLLYMGIEAVRGRPLSQRLQEIGLRFGVSALMLLMVFVVYNDIVNLFG